VRGSGNSPPGTGDGDSLNLGLDGVEAYRINGQWPASAGYGWGSTQPPATAAFVVATVGLHTLNVWMREDGFVLDKLVVSSNPSFNPTGLGPAESAIAPVLSVGRFGNSIVLTWPGGGVLQSSTNVVGTYIDIIGSSSHGRTRQPVLKSIIAFANS